MAEEFNTSQRIENIKKLKLQEIHIPDFIKYFDVWNFSECNPQYGMKGFEGECRDSGLNKIKERG